MQKVTLEQQQQLEKVAGWLSAGNKLFRAGKAATAPLDWSATAARHVAKPVASTIGAGMKLGGKAVKTLTDRVVTPALGMVGKVTGAAVGAPLAAGAGVATGLGKAGIKNVAAPAGRWYGRRLKNAPISTVAMTGLGGVGLHDIIKRNRARPFNTGPQARVDYNSLKQQFSKTGMAMTSDQKEKIEKVASLIESAKKVLNYGGVGPSMLGLGTLFALPMVAAPSANEFGELVKRTIFPVDQRIKADEEVAKKQLSMATTHDMEKALGRKSALGRQMEDMPVLESHINYLSSNDPVINDFSLQDPNKVDELRETLNTVYRFAPDIATNRQAAQSILRESATSPDGGLNYNTVKLIADAQKSISQGKY